MDNVFFEAWKLDLENQAKTIMRSLNENISKLSVLNNAVIDKLLPIMNFTGTLSDKEWYANISKIKNKNEYVLLIKKGNILFERKSLTIEGLEKVRDRIEDTMKKMILVINKELKQHDTEPSNLEDNETNVAKGLIFNSENIVKGLLEKNKELKESLNAYKAEVNVQKCFNRDLREENDKLRTQIEEHCDCGNKYNKTINTLLKKENDGLGEEIEKLKARIKELESK